MSGMARLDYDKLNSTLRYAMFSVFRVQPGALGDDRSAAIEDAQKFCARTEVFTLAESLGGIESLIEHPGAMTHASTAGSLLEVPANLVRLSVGIEDVDDILADLEQALQ